VAHRYRDLRAANHSLIPGAVETLERLRAQGVLLALVTNGAGAAQRAKIERFDLARHFDHIQIEGEFGLGKPHPRVYEVALRALEVAAEHAWFIGDNLEWDVAGPQQHGIYGVWVNPGGGPPSDPSVVPDRVVRTIAEL
jgi:putative hydrolase of the HAD superfamily